MIERKKQSLRPMALAAWTLIWFGTILAVNPHAFLSELGAVLWGAGLLVQMTIVARWLGQQPPASGAPAARGRPRRTPVRVF